MHELSLAQEIIRMVKQEVASRPRLQARAVTIAVGELSGVHLPSLQYGLEVLSQDSALVDVRWDCREIPVIGRCRQCSNETLIEELHFRCPVCDSSDMELIQGDDVQVESIEFEDRSEEH